MDEFWSNLLQVLMEQFAPVLVVVGVAYVGKVAGNLWAEFRANQPDAADSLEWAASVAVKAAEQAGAAEYIGSKKQYALKIAQDWLKMRGVRVDLALVDAAIEAAVYQHFNAERGAKPKGQAGFINATTDLYIDVDAAGEEE